MINYAAVYTFFSIANFLVNVYVLKTDVWFLAKSVNYISEEDLITSTK